MADKVTLAFDLYGTLLSTSSIAKELASHLKSDDEAAQVATTWRTLQLEYTWRLNSMGRYEEFSSVTQRSLTHALRANGHSTDCVPAVIDTYDALSTFSDVDPALKALRDHERFTCVVFSNGTPKMLKSSMHHSEPLKPHASLFQDVISVDAVKHFKPHPDVYRHLVKSVGAQGKESQVWLISGNPFDVVGARAMGMQAAWVDREGKGWVDELVGDETGKPTVIVRSLEEVTNKIEAWLKEQASGAI